MRGKAIWGVLLLILAAAVSLPAQEEKPPVDTTDPTDEKPDIKDPMLLEPGDLVALCRPELVFWPGERGMRAADNIYAGGKDTIPYLMDLLEDRDYRIKPAVADLLSRFGHQDAWEPCCVLLNHPGLKLKTKHVFAALYRLNPAETIRFCTDLLSADRRSLRRAAFNFMLGKTGLVEEKARFLELVESDEGDLRNYGFQLLRRAKIPPEELNAIALSLVGDSHAQLADEISRYLSSQVDDAVGRGLRELTSGTEDRVFSFAVLTLAVRDMVMNGTDLPEELKPKLDILLTSRNTLMRAAAAAGLTDLHLRGGTPEDAEALRSAVVPSFMEIFLGGQYTSDFSCLLEVSALCLRRATGAPFEKDLTFWKKWWLENGALYQREQSLLALNEQDLDRLVVHYESLGGSYPVRFSLAGEALVANPAFQRTPLTCFVKPEDFGMLVNGFYSAKFFERAARRATEDPGGLRTRIRVQVDNRTAEAVFLTDPDGGMLPGGGDRQFERLDATLMELFYRSAWQLLHRGADYGAWYFDNADWWHDPDTELERTGRFVSEMLDAFSLFSEDGILACCAWLRAREDLSAHFGLKELIEFGKQVRRSSRTWYLVRGMTDLVITLAAEDSARAEILFEPLTTFQFALYGERAFGLIAEVIVGLDGIETAAGDSRWFVRAACAQALRSDGEEALPQLISFFDDANTAVRIEALRSVALIGDTECRAVLAALVDRPKPETHRELVAALEGITEPWAYNMLANALNSEAGMVRLAAVKALALFDTRDARDLLLMQLRSTATGSRDWQAASARLVQAGGHTARDVLYKFYGNVQDPADQLHLVHQLADLGDTRIVIALLKFLEDGTDMDQVKKSLTLLLVKDFTVETWKYRELWEKYGGDGQAAFLERMLEQTAGRDGFSLPVAAPRKKFEGLSPEALVKALADSRWYVRLAALRILQEGSGRRFGYESVGRSATLYEMTQVRRAWEDWLERN